MANVPDAFVIGAQKCATTWIYGCLKQHPTLFLPAHKREVEYLANPRYRDDPGAFFALFDGARPEQTVVHVSVEYLFDPSAPRLIARHVPHARIVAALRNPVERAISAYYWNVRKAQIRDRSLTEGIWRVLEPDRYDDVGEDEQVVFAEILDRGRYDVQIERYIDAFPQDRVLVVLYDCIESEPDETVRQIFEFLGVEPDFRPTTLARRPKVSTNFGPTRWLERLLSAGAGRSPSVATRAASKISQAVNEGIVRLGGGAKPKLDPAARARLAALYKPHVEQLQQMLTGINVVGSELVPDLNRRWT